MTSLPPGVLPETKIGQVLGGSYKILRALDQGAMGSVFVAEHLRLKKQVAIKILATHLRENENAHARFVREAEIVSQLHHPHIVQIYDFDATEDGCPYLVMELIDGTPLDTYLQAHGPLAISTTVSIALQCASALHLAHKLSVVHRDLKPANVLVQSVNGSEFIKILDFGIGKMLGSPFRTRLTGEFDILGTPQYMAPEQALGKTAQTDARGDQYSLAILLYECLTGRVPYEGDRVSEILYRVIHEQAPPPSRFRSQIPPALDKAVLLALQKNPEDRYPTIGAFANALEKAVKGLDATPLAQPSITPSSRVRSRGPALDGRGTVQRLSTPSYRLDITPRQAFILSRIGREAKIALVVDLCPFPAEQTLEELRELVFLGYLSPQVSDSVKRVEGN